MDFSTFVTLPESEWSKYLLFTLFGSLVVKFDLIGKFVFLILWPFSKIYLVMRLVLKSIGKAWSRFRMWRAKIWMTEKTERIVDSDMRGHRVECMRNGSPLFVSSLSPVAVAIGTEEKPGNVILRGCGWRYKHWLITAEHVLAGRDTVVLCTKTKGPVEVQTTGRLALDTDAVAIPLTNAIWSTLGIASAKIAPQRKNTYVSISGTNSQGSCGCLKTYPVFGMLEYTGSTVGGFSGAPYMAANQVAAMHLAGGGSNLENIGYDASYLVALLPKEEETAEWIEFLVKKEKPVRALKSKVNSDEWIVEVDGKFHYLTEDEVQAMQDRGLQVRPEYRDENGWSLFVKESGSVPLSGFSKPASQGEASADQVPQGLSSSSSGIPSLPAESSPKKIVASPKLSKRNRKRLAKKLAATVGQQ